MIVPRNVRRAALCLCTCIAWSCSVYDGNLLMGDANASVPDTGTHVRDAGTRADSSVCLASPEICNGVDDDCDGMIDETAAVQADCESRILHAKSVCQMGKCVYLRVCDPGFYTCDGLPDNGCESSCPCATGCEDSGRLNLHRARPADSQRKRTARWDRLRGLRVRVLG
jgi:hypothetical protein